MDKKNSMGNTAVKKSSGQWTAKGRRTLGHNWSLLDFDFINPKLNIFIL